MSDFGFESTTDEVLEGHDLSGLFIGDILSAWNAAADLSAERHIRRAGHCARSSLVMDQPMR